VLQQAELATFSGSIDGETYANAKNDLGDAMASISQLKGEVTKLKGNIKELQADLGKERKNSASGEAGGGSAQRNLYKPEMRKYAVTTWGPGNQTNWSMQKAEAAAVSDPWVAEGKSKKENRDWNRYLSPMGDNCWACFLRTDTRIYNRHISLVDVWRILEPTWAAADRANDDLVPLHFWNTVKQLEADPEEQILLCYNVLAACDRLSYDINVELFRDIMAGQVHPSFRQKWVEFRRNSAKGLKKYTAARSLNASVEAICKDFAAEKSEEGREALKAAAAETMRGYFGGDEKGFDTAEEAGKAAAIDRLLDTSMVLDGPYNCFIEILYDQFVVDNHKGWKRVPGQEIKKVAKLATSVGRMLAVAAAGPKVSPRGIVLSPPRPAPKKLPDGL